MSAHLEAHPTYQPTTQEDDMPRTMRDQIVSELTQLDARKRQTDRHWNRYFIGIALTAMDGYDDDAERYGEARAFADRFTPSRELHAIARKLGLGLDVDRGRWIVLADHDVPA